MLAVLIGAGLAAPFLLIAWRTGLGREKAFYATLMMAIAFFYPVFAIGTDLATLVINAAIAAGFIAAAFYGYARRPWILPAALAAHALFDILVAQAGSPAPEWWAGLCIGVDLLLALGAALAISPEREHRQSWRPSR